MGWGPMEHQPHGPQQLAMRMVCLWGLVKAYQWTQQSVYICPPAPHILEAYNHKVNHNTHKELNLQECTVLQYAQTLQYVSYCNDARHRDRWAPMVKDFWAEVVKPFGSRALHNLDPSHLLGNAIYLIRGVKFWIMGFATTSCMSVLLSLKELRVGPSMKIGDADRRTSIDIPKWPWGTTRAPPAVLIGGPRSGTSKGSR